MENKLYDLTFPQKSIWYTEQFYKNTNINNIVGYLKIQKNTNFKALEKALNTFISKNDSFKLKVTIQDNIPKQYFDDFIYENIKIISLKDESQLLEFEKTFPKQTIDILDNFLFNAVMLSFPDTSGILMLNAHHLISDAWTMTLCLEQIYDNYVKFNNNEEVSKDINPSYKDFIKSNQEYYSSKKFEDDKSYWNKKFEILPGIVSFKDSTSVSISSNRKIFDFKNNLIHKINAFCKDNRISEYIFLLSIFGIYFRNIFNSDKYVIGNPVLNRSNFKEKHTTGMFVSVLPFIFNINDNKSFIQFIQNVSLEQKNMYRHLKYPYHEILNNLRKQHDFSGNLYDIVFSYQNSNIPSYCKWLPNYSQAESLQIHIKNLNNENNSLSIHYDYLTDIFSESDINLMHSRILNLINQVLSNPDANLSDLEIIDNTEKNTLLKEFNNTKSEYNKDSNIVKEFEKIALKYPNKIAVKDNKNSLTYKELNNRANFLANKIINSNIETEIIAFSLQRSINIIITILAILKSGHTYMPIDPDYPVDRINFMLENSNSKILITTPEFLENIKFNNHIINFSELEFNKIYDNPNIKIDNDKKAYIMYTSGSTGIPKAVTIKHYNVLNFTKSMQDCLDYNANHTNNVLSVTTVCFDIFVFEVFPTLLSGLTLIIANELEARSPRLLNETILKNNVTKILTTPSRMELLFSDASYLSCLSNLKEIILGGEPFPAQLLTELKKHTKARLLNFYGPTETTVYSTFKDLTYESSITIGKPINNTQIYILNSNNKLLPIGQIGEICIGGDGVGGGYFNNEEKTRAAFIQNPYGKDIIYKTGDLGYWKSNGELVCLGRKDHQIKIRGYRIELDDISNNILTFDNIEKCVVIDKDDSNGKKYLVAYFISSKDINISELKKYLIDLLPNYMIPTYFIRLNEFPLTLNHKIDRKSLPEPNQSDCVTEKEIILPKTKTEKKLYKLIKQSLKLSKISIDNDIFDYNIDSLDIINIQTKLLDLDIKLNTQDFYRYRTIEKISEFIDNSTDTTIPEIDKNYLSTINNSFFKHSKITKFNKFKYNNILLIGSTGYLGAHLLNELLVNTDSNIICIIRTKNNESAQDRLQSLYKFYFNKSLNLDRVKIFDSDITKKYLGLQKSTYNDLSKNVDLVINSAANVKYYGEYEDFKKVNVDLTDCLANFCIENNIKFVHISTLGISGNYLVTHEKNYNTFDEDDFYIGQKYNENVYIQTKFEAETLIYQKVSENLNATILRVGNLTGRYSDGHFQKNIEENAFYNILRMIFKYKIIPNTILDEFLEFTPIDYCATAIRQLLTNVDTCGYVFHIFNDNYLSAKELINILKELKIDVDILSGNEFKTRILEYSNIFPEENILKGIVNDLDSTNGLIFNSTVNQKNIYTNSYLEKLNFEWKKIDYLYIKKIVDYMKKNKYI